MNKPVNKQKYDYHQLDDLLHSRIRLSVVSILARCEKADFIHLRNEVKATDGNLTVHCRKLEEAGYISCEKLFIDRKPASFYSLTDTGKKALLIYAQRLAALLE